MLNKKNFQIARAFIKGSNGYSNLTCPCLKVENNQTVATDGSFLILMSGDNNSQEDYPIIEGFENIILYEKDNYCIPLDKALEVANSVNSKTDFPIFKCANLVSKKTTEGIKTYVVNQRDIHDKNFHSQELLNLNFPNYKSVIPRLDAENSLIFSLDAKKLEKIIKEILDLLEKNKKDSPCRIKFTIDKSDVSNNPIKIEAENKDSSQTLMALIAKMIPEDK